MYKLLLTIVFLFSGCTAITDFDDADKKIDIDVYLQDVMASSIDLAGLDKPKFIEFNSVMPFIKGEKTESYYDAIYGCYKTNDQRMIRKDGFKLIVYPKIKIMRLFDMENDPMEMNDLASNEMYGGKMKSLFEDLVNLQKEMDDPIDLALIFN